jgi:hypothetical protein
MLSFCRPLSLQRHERFHLAFAKTIPALDSELFEQKVSPESLEIHQAYFCS